MTDAAAREFRIGSVLARGFGVLFRNIVPFGLMAIVLTAPQWIYRLISSPQAGMGDPGLQVVVTLVIWLLSFLLIGAVVYGTVSELRGQRAGLGECVARGVAVIPPVLGVAILTALAIWLGSILFLVPGVIALVMLWVAIPVAVVERPGVLASLGRSRSLTKGSRWRVFGLIALVGMIWMLAVWVVIAISVFSGFGPGTLTAMMVALWILTALSTALYAVVSAVGYHDLRVAKEGVDAEQIAAVFD